MLRNLLHMALTLSVLMLGPIVGISYLLQAVGIQSGALQLFLGLFLWSPILLGALVYWDQSQSPLVVRLRGSKTEG